MTKKVITLTIDGNIIECPALQKIVGGKNAGTEQVKAWQAYKLAQITLPEKVVVCVLKDNKPYRQMTSENIAKGLELVKVLEDYEKVKIAIVNKLSALQVNFKAVEEITYEPEVIQKQLAQFAKAKK